MADLATQPADAERLTWASAGTGADRGRESASRKPVDPGGPRPAIRQRAARSQAAESTPAMPAAALRARSNPAGGFRDRSPSPPAMTTAPPRRPCDRAHRANPPRTAEFPDGWSPAPPPLTDR